MSAARSLFDLTGQRIWVFGGAGYLGQEVIQSLHAQGGHITCIDLKGRSQAFVSEAGLSDRVTPVDLDLTDDKATSRWIRETSEAEGVADAVVFLTTPSGPNSPVMTLGKEEFDLYNNAGLTSLFLAVREVGARMAKRGGGSIVLFSSMYGIVSPDPRVYHAPMHPNPLPYGMHKAALLQMTRYLAVFWGAQNVRTNAVVPGPFPNPPQQAAAPDFMERLASKVPLGRIGRQHEIAGAVTYLVSNASTYVTGQKIVVDGGWTAW